MTNWRDYGKVPYLTWFHAIDLAGGPEDLSSREAWDAAGEHSALALAMLYVESKYGTAFNRNSPANKNPLNLRPPSGIGYLSFPTWFEGVRAWRERITDPAYKGGVYARTTTLPELIHVYAPASDDNDEAAYVGQIAAKFLTWGVRPKEQSVVITAQPCPIEIAVLTGPSINRPALAMPDASFVTVHEVGNTAPGADEDMHRDFVHNGGGENAVSFHFVVGPTKAIQLIYLNENAWHASDYYSGRGNRDSIAIETIQIGDFNKTLSHLSWLIAEIFRNPTRFKYRSDVGVTDDLAPALAMERIKQHNFWAPDHKNCPQFIRDRGLWGPLLEAVKDELSDVAPDVKRYADPILPEWWSEQAVIDLRTHREDGVLYKPLGARVTALRDTGAYAHPWLPEGRGKRVRANIKKGETVDLRYVANHPATKDQWGITRFGTWIALKYFTPRYTVRNVVVTEE